MGPGVHNYNMSCYKQMDEDYDNYLKEEIRLNTERYQPKVWLLKQCIEWFCFYAVLWKDETCLVLMLD